LISTGSCCFQISIRHCKYRKKNWNTY
jgi:hypothetical protein